MEEPTNEQIGEMAHAAILAAQNKAEELGLHWSYFILGIERAMNAIDRFAVMFAVIGADGIEELGKALHDSEVLKMHKEAEEALNEFE